MTKSLAVPPVLVHPNGHSPVDVSTGQVPPTQPGAHQHPGYRTEPRKLVIVEISHPTEHVRTICFEDAEGRPLVSYEPGSHLIVSAGPHRNAYSLLGDGVNPYRYEISVLRRGEGRGSDWIHRHLEVGQQVLIEGPRSNFPPAHTQTHVLLIAGGIGVTPILSHARAAVRWGRNAEVLYAHRPDSGAHREELRIMADSGDLVLYEAAGSAEMTYLLRNRLADQPLGTHAYACGPTGLLETYLELGSAIGWPVGRLHFEHFQAPAPEPGVDFLATVASTGQKLTVPSGVTLLDTLISVGLPIPFLCRQGVCGECAIPIRGGQIEHRDHVFTTAEREAGNRMLSCVSRGTDLEVDL